MKYVYKSTSITMAMTQTLAYAIFKTIKVYFIVMFKQ